MPCRALLLSLVSVLVCSCSLGVHDTMDPALVARRNALPTTSAARDLWLLDDTGARAQRVATHVIGPYAAENHEACFKHFHHLYVPGTETLLTKGVGGDFSHHRGLFLGWSQTRVGGQAWDFWHGHKGARVEHLEFVDGVTDAEPGQATTSVSRAVWRAGTGEPAVEVAGVDGPVVDAAGVYGTGVVRETRWVRVQALGDGRVALDVDIELSADQVVELRGDPQHAGFQFRAAQEVATRKSETRYIRPEIAIHTGNDVWQDCGWAALVTPRTTERGELEVLIQHIDGPHNPRPMVYSTRDYGRFGSFFEADLVPGAPLLLSYRVVISDLGKHPEDAEGAVLAERARRFAEGVRKTGRAIPWKDGGAADSERGS